MGWQARAADEMDRERNMKLFKKKIYMINIPTSLSFFIFSRKGVRLINHSVIIPSSVFLHFLSHPQGVVVLFNFFSFTRPYLYSESISNDDDDDDVFLQFSVNPLVRQINESAFQHIYI